MFYFIRIYIYHTLFIIKSKYRKYRSCPVLIDLVIDLCPLNSTWACRYWNSEKTFSVCCTYNEQNQQTGDGVAFP